MDAKRYYQLESDPASKLTKDELNEGWHFCIDWDLMLIGPGMYEYHNCCTCKLEETA